MSDEQWLWLFVNQKIDIDEKLERMCPKCRNEVTSSHRCIRCGKDLDESESFVNPNFDMDRYNKLAGHVEELYEDEENDEYDDRDTTEEQLDDDEYYEEEMS